MRKVDEVPLGPEYDGSKVSRKALLDGNEDQDVLGSETAEEKELESGSDEDDTKFADPDDLEFDVDDEDGDIDSENALGPSDDEKFQKFAFRGSSRPKDAPNGQKKRPTAADFMSDSEDEEEGARLRAEDDAGADETDEDLLDVDAQHNVPSQLVHHRFPHLHYPHRCFAPERLLQDHSLRQPVSEYFLLHAKKERAPFVCCFSNSAIFCATGLDFGILKAF